MRRPKEIQIEVIAIKGLINVNLLSVNEYRSECRLRWCFFFLLNAE